MQATIETEIAGAMRLKNRFDHDLVHELSRRLEALCRYAQCIANAEGNAKMEQTWRDLEQQELANIRTLRELIASRIEKGEFLEGL